jgi:hypothetical protein
VQNSNSPAPVTTWARVLAWLLVLASLFAVFGGTLAWLSGRPPPWRWYQIFPFVICAIWLLPVFFIVAIRGRPPKYWWGLRSVLGNRG